MSIRRNHILVGLVLLDRHVSVLIVLDVYTRDLSVFDFHGSGVGPFLLDHMVPVGFDFLAEQFLPVLMVRLGRCNRGIDKGEQAENDKDGREKTLYTVTVHGSSPVLSAAAVSFCMRISVQ